MPKRSFQVASGRVAIEKIAVEIYRIPTNLPESDGTLKWDSTTLVLVRVRAGGLTGLGYTYADTATGKLIHDLLAKVVEGRDAMGIPACWEAMVARTRNLGRSGDCVDGNLRGGHGALGPQSPVAQYARGHTARRCEEQCSNLRQRRIYVVL